MDARKGRVPRVHVRAAAPAVVRGRQLQADLVFEHMRRRIDLDVHGPPQGDPHRRAVWGNGLPIAHWPIVPAIQLQGKSPVRMLILD